ncbi:MAG: hypothetical protein ABI949_10815 [Ilumatobacteraceae bacterium]
MNESNEQPSRATTLGRSEFDAFRLLFGRVVVAFPGSAPADQPLDQQFRQQAAVAS